MNSNSEIKVFSYDAGGANLTMAYAYYMHEKGYIVKCYPKGPALKIFKRHISFLIDENENIFKKDDIVIIGTSGIHSDYEIEKLIEAKKLGLKVKCFLDSILNLNIRFSINNKFIDRKYLPDIIYYDNKVELINEDIKQRIQFHENLYLKYIKEVFYAKKLKTSNNLILENRGKYALFLSEYIYELYGDKFGFTEYDSIINLLDAISSVDLDIILFIKFHPAEDMKKFDKILKKYSFVKIYKGGFDIHEVLYNSKIVFGIDSSVFKESLLLNKQTYSLQIDAKERINVIENVDILETKAQLETILRNTYEK
ncbi:hypothetical protein CRU96_01755 [Malaciobacter halophilus]|nr:hypothetical protein CRU96_01755 [Malaciobacter halophilus]